MLYHVTIYTNSYLYYVSLPLFQLSWLPFYHLVFSCRETVKLTKVSGITLQIFIFAESKHSNYTNSTKRSPSGADNRSTGPPVWNLKDHYRVHKSPLLVTILRQMHPFLPSYSIYLRSFFIMPSRLRLRLPSCLFPSRFTTKIFYVFLMRATCPIRLILPDLITLMIFSEASYR
jgi:hypothetical protein